MKTTLKKISILFILIVSTNICLAQSFYSQRGLGLVNYFVSGRSEGMGGVGLASTDKLSVNFLNPAALTNLSITFISGEFRHEATGLDSDAQDASFSDTNVMGAQFHIPLKNEKMSLALGLMPYSTIDYSFERTGSVGGFVYDDFLSGDGGINTAFLSFAFKPFNRLSLGATGLFYFGSLRYIERVVFPSSAGYVNTQYEISDEFTSSNIRLGMQFKASPSWTIGAVITPSLSSEGNKSVFLENIADLEDLQTVKLEIPLSIGVGTNVFVTKKFLIGLDYYLQKWGNVGVNGYNSDSQRLSFGAEFSGRGNTITSSYWSRVALRAGFYYSNLGLEDPVGESVTEKFVTFGLGLPIKWSAGRIDLSVALGQRGTLSKNPFKENVARVSATVTVGERWFFRKPAGR